MRPSSVAEEPTEHVQWSNADIEFPSTSTSDEIEIISQPDDETICKLLSALPIPSETVHSPNESGETVENPDIPITNTETSTHNDVFSKSSSHSSHDFEHSWPVHCIFVSNRLHTVVFILRKK